MDMHMPLVLWTLFVFVVCIHRPRIFGKTEQQTGFVAGVNITICMYTLTDMIFPMLKSLHV